MHNIFNTPIEEGGATPNEMFLSALESADAAEAPAQEVPAEAPAEEVAAEAATPEVEQPMSEAIPTEPTAGNVPPSVSGSVPRLSADSKLPEDFGKAPDEETVARAVEDAESQITAPAQAGVVEEAELPDFNSEEFMDEFYDNPASAVEKAANIIADKKVKEVVSGIEKRMAPLLRQSEVAQLKDEVRSAFTDFLNNTPDGKDYVTDMIDYMRSSSLDPKDARSYQDAYRVSKLGRQDSRIRELEANQGRSLNDYLADEASFNEILNNENVKNKVIENYLSGLSNGGKPATLGNGAAEQAPASAVNKARTMEEAKRMLIDRLNQ